MANFANGFAIFMPNTLHIDKNACKILSLLSVIARLQELPAFIYKPDYRNCLLPVIARLKELPAISYKPDYRNYLL
jgi:hypothetical protein